MVGDTEEPQETIPLHQIRKRDNKYRSIFEQCDANRDGFISINELEIFINSHDEEAKIIPKKILEKIHRMADLDGDKQLDFKEFVEMMENEELLHILGRYVNGYVNFLVPRSKATPTTPFSLRFARSVDEPEDEQMIDEFTCCPPPIFLFLISILEFAFFITDELTQKDSTLSGSGVTAKIFIYDPSKRSEVWRYLTYMFVHIGYQHIFVNLGVQIILGVPLEMVHKCWRIAIIYFTGGLAGSLAHSIADPHIRLGGASGGVYALMTAHISNVIMNWSEMQFPFIQLFLFGLLICTDLGSSIYQRYYLNLASNVGIAAHVGGALAGLLVGIYTLRNLRITNTEKYVWWLALVVYVLLMGSAIIANIFWL